jgi:membrane protease YdiL (CAAX protease family)
MRIALEISTVLAVAILPHLLGSIFILTNRDYLKHFLPWQRMVSSALHDVSKILLMLYIAAQPSNGLAAIGLSIDPDRIRMTIFIAAFATGYLSLIFVIARLRSKKQQQAREELRRSVFEVGGFSTFKTPGQRGAYLPSLWLGVIAEDLVFRGYLVLGLGARTGTLAPWIALSILLSVVMHLYQGLNWHLMFTQAVFSSIFIAAAVTSGNILAAIIPHLVYDTIWILQGWMKADQRSTA